MFRTELKPTPASTQLDIQSPLLAVGSCFANDIGKRLKEYKFDIVVNPGGILFNPVSIFEWIEIALNDELPVDSSFLVHDGIYLNHKLHSDVNANSKEELIEKIRAVNYQLKDRLLKAHTLLLTFGTAWTYRLRTDDSLVANCHKVPQQEFHKVLLTKEDIVAGFRKVRAAILEHNPNIKFITTVSPVRHIKDTLELNSVSKSILRLATHEIKESYADTTYFPSYELMMDDLRDYRFYKNDMLHPSDQAIKYIWQKFMATHINEKSTDFVTKWSKIKSALNHKPFHAGSEGHQKFLKDLAQKIEKLGSIVDVSEELADLNTRLL